jgi:hypothetical protein
VQHFITGEAAKLDMARVSVPQIKKHGKQPNLNENGF